jgi:hypothetical protein
MFRLMRSRTCLLGYVAGTVTVLGLSVACTGGTGTTHSPSSTPTPTTATAPATSRTAQAPVVATQVTPMTDISRGCAGSSAEVEEATAAPGYVYATWIGCGGIGFARSADSGARFSAAVTVPGSAGHSWDPAIAVGPDGTVYVSYMHANGPFQAPNASMYPVVAASRDHGASFPQLHQALSPQPGNWGDRDFIAVGRTGELYLTWDYGPSAAEIKTLCNSAGSCAYAAGDLNAVIQSSADGGKTWGPITHIEPGFPLGGGYSAPLVVSPSGGLDVLYIRHPANPRTRALSPGYEYFTSSADGTHWPASPQKLWPGKGTLSLPEWWIDGDISTDSAGNLYATWDTQTAAGDIGWLSYSADGGRTWSAPVRVTPDTTNAPHIVESAGGQSGVAYVAWQTSAPKQGYATYLRPFSIQGGWLGPAIQVSTAYGNAAAWPGDTFGISTLPGGRISLTWGSATRISRNSAIYASVVTLSRG